MRTIYLAGGCFWGMQKFFDQFSGIAATEVGYANGPDIISTGCLDSGKLLIGLALTVCGIALAYFRYCRKDIR